MQYSNSNRVGVVVAINTSWWLQITPSAVFACASACASDCLLVSLLYTLSHAILSYPIPCVNAVHLYTYMHRYHYRTRICILHHPDPTGYGTPHTCPAHQQKKARENRKTEGTHTHTCSMEFANKGTEKKPAYRVQDREE